MNKVSVIVPNYNHADFIVKRLESVLEQGSFVNEVIVLDDSSTDGSLQKIRLFENKGIQVLKNDVNSGNVFVQWEKGIKLAKGEFIWLAESDDFCKPDFLKTVLPHFEDPEVVLVYTRSVDVDEKDREIGLSYRQYEWCDHSFQKDGLREISDHLFYRCTIPNASAVVFRKSALNSSCFDHSFRQCGDWYFYLQILGRGKIVYISEPLNCHRFHSNTIRNNNQRSLDILGERLHIVTDTSRKYSLGVFRLWKSAFIQVDLYLAGITFKKIFSSELVRSMRLIAGYNPVYIFFLFPSFIKKLVKRIF